MNFKNVMIFGDSYSTFRGFIPEENAFYYNEDTGETDVRQVTETWWHLLMNETGSNLVLNDSWSGSTICHTGYDNKDCSKTSSFVCRLDKFIENGFFKENEINTVFVFGATNDSWANSPIGSLKFDNFKTEDLFSVLPAVCYLFGKLKATLPKARIVCLVNTDLKEEIADGMKKACEHYGVNCVALKDIDKIYGHPLLREWLRLKTRF